MTDKDDWPESFTDFGSSPRCDHYYQWYPELDAYKCIKCEHIRQEPPEVDQ